GMIRNLDANYRGPGAKTIFDRVAASFRIDKGQAVSEDFALDAPLLSLAGGGRVDLPGRAIDWTLRPTRIEAGALNAQGLTEIPIRIKGPWARPAISLDLSAAVRARAEAEGRKLEEKLKEEAGKAIGRALGAPAASGGGGTPAVPDAGALGGALKGLLGGN
ncbi:MAG: hypothetical protein D6832_02530, partial [Alphaproteobacteria bacterium]